MKSGLFFHKILQRFLGVLQYFVPPDTPQNIATVPENVAIKCAVLGVLVDATVHALLDSWKTSKKCQRFPELLL